MKLTKRKLKIDGLNLEYYKEGKGSKTIILLPGLGSDCSLWDNIIPKLSNNFRVFAFSIPPYGSKSTNSHVYTIRTYDKLVEKLIKKFNIKKPVLVGHSVGGLAALVYCSKHPRSVKKLILVSTPLTDLNFRLPI